MHPLVQEILDLVEELQSRMEGLNNIINDALSWVPWGLGWVVDRIHDAWDWLMEKWNEFWDAANLIFGNMGDHGAITTAAQGWATSVGTPVAEQATNADRAILQADGVWTGEAAASYFPKALLQKNAMTAVQDSYVKTASEALDTVKSGLVKFYGSLVLALGTLVGGFIAAAGASGTIIGIPAGIAIAAGACLAAIGSFYAGGTLLKSDCSSAQTKLLTESINGAFPSGNWPPAAVLVP